jgi:hypothetical protein
MNWKFSIQILMIVEWIHVWIMVHVLILYMIFVVNVYQDLLDVCVNMIYVNVMIHFVGILGHVIWVLMVMHNVIVIKYILAFSVKLVRRKIKFWFAFFILFISGVHPCFPNPCTNGGTCVARGNKIACLCRNRFTGNQCEKRLDI